MQSLNLIHAFKQSFINLIVNDLMKVLHGLEALTQIDTSSYTLKETYLRIWGL